MARGDNTTGSTRRGKGKQHIEEQPEVTQEERQMRERQMERDSKYPFLGGPSVNDVLVDYEGHVAREVWEERKTRRLLTCNNHWALVGRESTISDRWHYSDECEKFGEFFLKTGLRWLADCNYPYIDRLLVSAFVERWHPETSSFHFPWGEMTITLHDVEQLLGLKIQGELLDPEEKIDHEKCGNLIAELFGLPTTDWLGYFYSNTQGFTVTESSLRARFKNWCSQTDNDDRITMCVKGYCLYLLCCTVACNKSSNRINVIWMLTLKGTLDEIGSRAWGLATLVTLYLELGKASRQSCAGIAGYLTLLQAWIYLHFPALRENYAVPNDAYNAEENDLFAYSWKIPKVRKTVGDVEKIRKYLDSNPVTDVLFQPYPTDQFNSFIFFTGVLYWYDANAPYQPERVLRQYGYIQTIPAPPISPDTSVRPANVGKYKHAYNLLRSLHTDWPTHSIELRLRQSFEKAPAERPYLTADGYLEWFERVSHPLVHPPSLEGVNDHIWQAGVRQAIIELELGLKSGIPPGKKKPVASIYQNCMKKVITTLQSISCYKKDDVGAGSSTALVVREQGEQAEQTEAAPEEAAPEEVVPEEEQARETRAKKAKKVYGRRKPGPADREGGSKQD